MANLIDRLTTEGSKLVDRLKSESTIPDQPEAQPPQMAAESVPVPMCSKCGKNPRADTDGKNPWCKECRAAYQREYENRRLGRKESKGFALGVSETKELLAQEFERLGSGMFEGDEIAALIRRAPGPSLKPEDLEPERDR